LAAGLRLDPLGELKRSPRPSIAAIRGPTFKGGEGKGGRREKTGRTGEGERREWACAPT